MTSSPGRRVAVSHEPAPPARHQAHGRRDAPAQPGARHQAHCDHSSQHLSPTAASRQANRQPRAIGRSGARASASRQQDDVARDFLLPRRRSADTGANGHPVLPRAPPPEQSNPGTGAPAFQSLASVVPATSPRVPTAAGPGHPNASSFPAMARPCPLRGERPPGPRGGHPQLCCPCMT